MSASLQGKTILVTGGSRGIGAAIVRELANRGADVFFTYNSNKEKAEQLAAELSAAGRVTAVECNVTDADSVANFVATVQQHSKTIDGLVNNAGITKDGLIMRMSEGDWDAVMDANLKGAFLCARAVVRPMMSQRSGRIVNIGSIVGLSGNAGQTNYSASKAGLVGFTKSLAKEVASRGILVNLVAPGYVETDMTDKLSEEQRAAFANNIPLKRAGAASEIAAAVAFFLSAESSYITGQVLNVDGGLAM